LGPAFGQYDVDVDTLESLREMVVGACDEDAGGDARSLATALEDLFEPFLLALGAEPTALPGVAMQVAVSLRGLPAMPEAEVPVAQAPSPQKFAPAARAPEAAKPAKPAGLTLADVCAGGRGGGVGATGAKAKAKGVAGDGPPRTLGALWAAQGDLLGEVADGAWVARPADESAVGVEEDDSEEGGEEVEETAAERRAKERQRQKQEGRAKRLAATEAAVNAVGAAEVGDDLGEVAAYGLREARQEEAEAADPSSPGGGRRRGRHTEGPGGRNVHLEGVSIVLTGDQGSKEILREADLHLAAGHVYGLIGKNGSGKTTLLRRLAVKAIDGMPRHLSTGYVAQELAALRGDTTPLQAVVDADEERRELLRERGEIEAVLAGAEQLTDKASLAKAEEIARRYSEIEQRLVAIEADGAEERAEVALTRLGFDASGMRRPIGELSGGWRMRLALARALSSRPDILLLDEPTNHLDLHGVLWLQEHLRREWGEEATRKDRIVVVVSHDRSFLDACVTDVLEIHECKLRNFPGNYSSYLERVADEQRLLLLRKSEAEKEEKLAKKELSSMKKRAREHADDKKVRQLKSREKKLERSFQLSSMRDFGKDDDAIVTKLREDGTLRFRFPEPEVALPESANLLEMDAACIRQGSTVILKKVTLTLDAQSRVAIVGGNGAGKSTLMRALAGELAADEGPRGRGRKHAAFKPGFVSQNHLESQAGHLHDNCIEYLRRLLPDKNTLRGGDMVFTKQSDDSVLWAHLGNFGLGRDALKKVGYLSGGQKARLSLATATWWGPGALLLDEPTNHLDVDSLDALTLGLQAFDGPVIVVSHSRGFLEALCTELWIVKDGSVKVCPKGEEAFAEYFAKYVAECKRSVR